ncbi:MAG: hypothetical protein J7452_13565 [Thermoflexus sp.]|jgi:hypothetical protein|nr:hypothetical protein [Thermoflexus sp.]
MRRALVDDEPSEPEEALRIDLRRMKIEETFRDVKGPSGWGAIGTSLRSTGEEGGVAMAGLCHWVMGRGAMWGVAGGGGGSEWALAEGEMGAAEAGGSVSQRARQVLGAARAALQALLFPLSQLI